LRTILITLLKIPALKPTLSILALIITTLIVALAILRVTIRALLLAPSGGAFGFKLLRPIRVLFLTAFCSGSSRCSGLLAAAVASAGLSVSPRLELTWPVAVTPLTVFSL
jgi:hypothetical protein